MMVLKVDHYWRYANKFKRLKFDEYKKNYKNLNYLSRKFIAMYLFTWHLSLAFFSSIFKITVKTLSTQDHTSNIFKLISISGKQFYWQVYHPNSNMAVKIKSGIH